jgi:large subunit ribosomal protein L15
MKGRRVVELLDLSNLHPAPGARRRRKRIGRGPGSGHGKTAGRGHKGKGARSGGNVAPGYEGGQMPLQRRLPKRGFRPIARRRYAIVKVGQLERFEGGTVVDGAVLVAAGLVRAGRPVKLLADGELSKALAVRVDRASEAARARVTAAGGSVETPAEAAPEGGGR